MNAIDKRHLCKVSSSNSMMPVRVAREMSQLLCIVLLLLTCSSLSAQIQEHRIPGLQL